MIEHRMSTRLRLALIRETPEYIDRNTRLFPSQFRQGHEAVRSLLSQPLTILVLAWGLCSLAGYAMLLRTAQTPAYPNPRAPSHGLRLEPQPLETTRP